MRCRSAPCVGGAGLDRQKPEEDLQGGAKELHVTVLTSQPKAVLSVAFPPADVPEKSAPRGICSTTKASTVRAPHQRVIFQERKHHAVTCNECDRADCYHVKRLMAWRTGMMLRLSTLPY